MLSDLALHRLRRFHKKALSLYGLMFMPISEVEISPNPEL